MVEWKKLGDISDIGTGSNNREDASDIGQYPFYVRSKEVLRINSYLYDEEAILIPGEGGIGEIFHYVNGKYGLHQRTYRVHPVSKEVIGRYLYYYLFENFGSYIEQKSFKSTAASIRKPMLTGFPVAILTISDQKRIVGILDTFTSSIDNLKQQIAQRRKQYEYYRDQLLDLEGKPGVEMKTLGEVCEISAGGDVPKDNMSQTKTDVFCIPIVSNGVGDKSIYGYTDLKKINKTSVTVAARGTIGYAEYRDYPYYPIVRLISVTPLVAQINARFLYYLLSKQKYKIPKSGIPQLTVPVISKVIFPLPPLSEQQRIVSILDTFEASIQNLEAQLKEREKQYEYYRNKLLTFE